MLVKGLLLLHHLYLFLSHAAAGPTFLVTTPLDIRPGLNVTLGIAILEDAPTLVKVRAEIQKENRTLLGGEGLFQKGSFGTLVLPEIPKTAVNGRYHLSVKGFSEGQLIFSNKTLLEFKSKSFSVFIQTNSVIYKPSQEVKIRILAFRILDLKPYKSTIDIHILDPQGNLIEQWLEEETDLGVVSKSFHLSENPPLGDWAIKVKLHQQLHYQTFTVMEHVLPRFEVLMTTPLYHSMKNEFLEGTVTVKYTYGMPVQGKLTAQLLHTATYKRKTNITKTFEINGYAKIQFSQSELKELLTSDSLSFTGPVDLLVIVTDYLTGISQNQTTTIYLINREYYSEFYDYPTVLKPTLNFTASLKILRYDGKQLTSEERKFFVAITITRSLFGETSADNFEDIVQNGERIVEKELLYYSVPENGIIHMEIPLLANTTHLKIKAEFLDSVNHIFINDVFNSPSKAYLQIKKSNQNIKVGTPFSLTIDSNIPLKEINYLVVSRGQIVSVGKENTTAITLKPEISWTPEACLIFYNIANDGTIINDAVTVTIQPIFENQIVLLWNTTQARPFKKVSLTVNVTEPNSIVALSVVDKSVKLLGDRMDITSKRVAEELSDHSKTYMRQIISPAQVFESCNIGVITDANLAQDDNKQTWYTPLEDTMEEMPRPWFPFDLSKTHVKSYFPETWIWKEIKMRSKTNIALEVEVPETITSWIANAYVMSENLGFGILTPSVQLESFQPFCISFHLPNSVILEEILILEIVVFNYLEEDTEVSITLFYSEGFAIHMSSTNNIGAHQNISVPSQEGKSVHFPIVANKLGTFPIKVQAVSSLASDIVTQNLLIKAEGIEHLYSKTVLLELLSDQPQTISKSLDFTFPHDVVSGSEKAFITVGDILGPSLSNIQSLIQLPFGCGEQNMITFAPNIFIMDYLTTSKKLTEDHALKLVSLMKNGYQTELTYQREDGSFSAFGSIDPSGSTWLSAFVLSCFLRARSYILVDPGVLHKTLTWILKHQKKSGEFWEPGRVINKQIQGGVNSPIILTAYIMSSLTEYTGLMDSSQMTAAADFLESQSNDVINDNYTLSLVTYALSLVGRSKAKECLVILNMRAERKGELRFWKSPAPKASNEWQASSEEIMTASYVLMSHVIQHQAAEGLAVMKWLIQQRGHLGGFSSSQDTIVALQALSLFASVYTVDKTALTIAVNENYTKSSASLIVNDDNRMLLQSKQINVEQPMKLTVSAEGTGFALLQLNIIYNLRNSISSLRQRSAPSQEVYDLSIIVLDEKENEKTMNLNVCIKCLDMDTSSSSGMILMQVNLLSGFSLSPDGVTIKYPVKKVESITGIVYIYFDSLNETQICLDIRTIRDFDIANNKDGIVSVIDYYDPRRRTVRSYNSEILKKRSFCSYCKNGCTDCLDNGTIGFQQHPVVMCLLMIMLILQMLLL